MMANQEANRKEYKEKLTDDLEKSAVAFLNSDGGDIYIGIRDDGFVYGVDKPDETQLKIKDRLKNNIRPNIMGLFDIITEKLENKTIVLINFASGTEKPYYIKQKGLSEAGCFIRVGSSSQAMPESMIDKLMAKRRPLSMGNIPSKHQNLEFETLKLYYGVKNKTLNDNLAQTLDLLTADGKYNQIAYLFADNNRFSFRVGKYAGKDKLELIGNEEYGDCCLIRAMQRVLDRLEIENITQARKVGMGQRVEKNLVDKKVAREAIINAFAHNDYSQGHTPIFEIFSDKFVITSYGGLVEGLTLEKFYSGTSMPRNREIMRIFKDLEFVEQLGSGIPKIVKKYGKTAISLDGQIMQIVLKFDKDMNDTKKSREKNNEKSREKNTKKHTEVIAGNRDKSREKNRDKSREKILDLIGKSPSLTTAEIAKILGLTPKAIEKNLKILRDNGSIYRIGADKGGHWSTKPA
jgi:predicted HTH transcriptional regulator